jgi:transcription termination factor Rho
MGNNSVQETTEKITSILAETKNNHEFVEMLKKRI